MTRLCNLRELFRRASMPQGVEDVDEDAARRLRDELDAWLDRNKPRRGKVARVTDIDDETHNFAVGSYVVIVGVDEAAGLVHAIGPCVDSGGDREQMLTPYQLELVDIEQS